jgi:DAACS family dicarboxylate/amino acid:cation (Na+ or H+) symporter
VEGIALILGVDRVLDMMRTACNVTGDCAVTCIIASGENALDKVTFSDPAAGSVRKATSELGHRPGEAGVKVSA